MTVIMAVFAVVKVLDYLLNLPIRMFGLLMGSLGKLINVITQKVFYDNGNPRSPWLEQNRLAFVKYTQSFEGKSFERFLRIRDWGQTELTVLPFSQEYATAKAEQQAKKSGNKGDKVKFLNSEKQLLSALQQSYEHRIFGKVSSGEGSAGKGESGSGSGDGATASVKALNLPGSYTEQIQKLYLTKYTVAMDISGKSFKIPIWSTAKTYFKQFLNWISGRGPVAYKDGERGEFLERKSFGSRAAAYYLKARKTSDTGEMVKKTLIFALVSISISLWGIPLLTEAFTPIAAITDSFSIFSGPGAGFISQMFLAMPISYGIMKRKSLMRFIQYLFVQGEEVRQKKGKMVGPLRYFKRAGKLLGGTIVLAGIFAVALSTLPLSGAAVSTIGSVLVGGGVFVGLGGLALYHFTSHQLKKK